MPVASLLARGCDPLEAANVVHMPRSLSVEAEARSGRGSSAPSSSSSRGACARGSSPTSSACSRSPRPFVALTTTVLEIRLDNRIDAELNQELAELRRLVAGRDP